MKKSDLMTGDLVEFKNGYIVKVMLNTPEGDILCSMDEQWVNLDRYSDNLLNKYDKEFNIIKVYRMSFPYKMLNFYELYKENLIWEREDSNSIDNLTVNISAKINQESIDEIENIVSKLEERLQNIKIGFNIK